MVQSAELWKRGPAMLPLTATGPAVTRFGATPSALRPPCLVIVRARSM